ncbi:MAG: YggS family pyridoxal phosphate-dependent enzyme [Rhodothermales bacterium]
MTLEERLEAVRTRMAQAARRSGRDPGAVTLIAVSKTFPAQAVRDLHSLGQTDFGENKVQEFQEKSRELADTSIRWHLIGHLQRNKAKDVTEDVSLFHGLDSIRLARELQKRLLAAESRLDCLLQVNVSNEDSKFGVPVSQVASVLDGMTGLNRIHIRGFMTLASPADNPEDVRGEFALLKDISTRPDVAAHLVDAAHPVLSMGMSNDFEVAIEEGATHVRVGSALFGSRDPYLPG